MVALVAFCRRHEGRSGVGNGPQDDPAGPPERERATSQREPVVEVLAAGARRVDFNPRPACAASPAVVQLCWPSAWQGISGRHRAPHRVASGSGPAPGSASGTTWRQGHLHEKAPPTEPWPGACVLCRLKCVRSPGSIPDRTERTCHGRRVHAPAPRERCPLRTPDPPLEPEDEALHLHGAQRHLHRRPAAVAALHRQRLRLRQGDGRPRRLHPLRRHQEAGPGAGRRAGRPRRDALREPPLARWHAHQLHHGAQASPAPQGARGDRLRRRGRLGPHEEGAPGAAPREGQARAHPRRYP